MPPRDPERIDEIISELEEYWKDNPQLRLGQILGNAAAFTGYNEPYYMADHETLYYLKQENEE